MNMIMNVFKNGNVNIKKDFVDGEYRNMEEFILAICYENGSDFTLGEEAMEFAPQRMTLYNYHTGLFYYVYEDDRIKFERGKVAKLQGFKNEEEYNYLVEIGVL